MRKAGREGELGPKLSPGVCHPCARRWLGPAPPILTARPPGLCSDGLHLRAGSPRRREAKGLIPGHTAQRGWPNRRGPGGGGGAVWAQPKHLVLGCSPAGESQPRGHAGVDGDHGKWCNQTPRKRSRGRGRQPLHGTGRTQLGLSSVPGVKTVTPCSPGAGAKALPPSSLQGWEEGGAPTAPPVVTGQAKRACTLSRKETEAQRRQETGSGHPALSGGTSPPHGSPTSWPSEVPLAPLKFALTSEHTPYCPARPSGDTRPRTHSCEWGRTSSRHRRLGQVGTLSSRARAPGSQWRQEQGRPHGPAPEPGVAPPHPTAPHRLRPHPTAPVWRGRAQDEQETKKSPGDGQPGVRAEPPPTSHSPTCRWGPLQASAPSKEAALPRRPPSPGN